MEFRKHVLANGLEIVAECNPRAYSTAIGFFVKTGARDESASLAGVSHFLEHMAFKGTATRSAADVNRHLDEMGSHSNAYTSEEQTVYYATVLPEYQQRVTDLLADIMRPALRQEDFDTEKRVIIEEIKKYEDQPPFGAFEKCMAAYFGSHPLSQNVLGTEHSVGELTSQQMRDYWRERYSPGNMTLAAAGCVDFEQLVRSAQSACGEWQPYSTSRAVSPAPGHASFHVMEKDSSTQQYAVQLCPGPAAEDDDRYANRIRCTILGDDSGSRLFWELVDTGRAEYAVVGPYEYLGTGITMAYLASRPENMTDNLQTIYQMQQEIERHGVTADELELAKNKICSHLVLQSERPSSRLFSVGNNWVQRQTYRTVKETINQYLRVTEDDVLEVGRKYPFHPSAHVIVGPLREIRQPR